MNSFTAKDYLNNPTGTSALAYWKRNLPIPKRIKVYHQRDYRPELAKDGQVERYFRLVHRLSGVYSPGIPAGIELRQLTPGDDDALIIQMNRAYANQGIEVNPESLQTWRSYPVYYPEGWLGLFKDNQLIASVITELDEEIGEGVIDWLQVDPKYQRFGLGQIILSAALYQLAQTADFVTVSGSLENESNPEAVYRLCGFEGNDIWYIVVH